MSDRYPQLQTLFNRLQDDLSNNGWKLENKSLVRLLDLLQQTIYAIGKLERSKRDV